ncbi:hypothetical protein QWJ26_24365 [Streptomyces sp. CSDS2]|uniref:hypothetical protein n=1 Tax=Streptomyces sp. CSDS2 TaxID=3055051 RepID=UPI0025B03DAA|nr:hypothetical protein [Streptomyces sp. CSDS2]MDN3262883.1 hypothetical protein [Streptomyces sp. CSDS2]
MTETPAAPETPRVLSPRDEARVRFALQAERISDEALDLLPIDPAAPRGGRLRRALALKELTDTLINRAVIAEREEGTTWAQLADAAGITKQAAHERWARAVTAWARTGRTVYPPDSAYTALEAARRLDRVHADRHPDHPQDAVSSGLDAVRFPGAVAAEAARRERAAALYARIEPLDARLARLSDEWRLLTEGGARPEARAAVLTSQAALEEETAALYEELTAAEPELADEHRESAERARSNAAADREYAELLAAKAQAGTEAGPVSAAPPAGGDTAEEGSR